MSASMLARQRKRRRAAAFRYAHDLLGRRLPNGSPAAIREWVAGLTADEIQYGPNARELADLLGQYRRPWFGP